MQVQLDNAAFEDNEGWELARVLRLVAENVGYQNTLSTDKGSIRDSFGNTVGHYFCKENEGDSK
jgi:hypothetical protein